MKELNLSISPLFQIANLDSCLVAIFGLDHITNLYLDWDRLSMEMIKSALKMQGGKKRWEIVGLSEFDRGMNDSDLLEICSYLPKLKEWDVLGTRFTLTIDGAREWKRICPLLETVDFVGDEELTLTDEVKEVLQGLDVVVR
jgi:hypothetical protein